MIKSHSSHSSLLEEASSVKTSPQRLQQLLQDDPSLGAVIASNPSASFQSLDQLALHFPAEVLTNPLLPLRSLEAKGAYGDFSLPALICLCLVSDTRRDNILLEETKIRIQAALDRLQGQEILLECDWLYSRDFTLLPEDCDGIINGPLDFTIEVRANMYAKGEVIMRDVPYLEELGLDISRSQIDLFSDFMRAVAAGEIRDYINEEYLTREDGGGADVELKVAELPVGLSVDGRYICSDDDGCILEVYYNFDGGDTPPVYEDGMLTVPVDFEDEVNHRYQFAMGELGDLVDLKSKCTALPSNWHQQLAKLLLQG